MNLAVSVSAALAAGGTFAVSAVLQQRVAHAAPDSASLRFRLLLDLLRRPLWLAGMASLIAGYCLQALALAFGTVSLVEPLVVTELVFALPLATRSEHRRPGRREWLGAGCVVGGVAMFLIGASPGGGHPDPEFVTWVLMILPVAVVVAALIAAARGPRSPRRAALLAAAAGISFGLLALFTKNITYLLKFGVTTVLSAWQLYALIGIGVVSFLFAQSAYQAASLQSSLPVIDALEPTVAVLLAAGAFGERISHDAVSLTLEALGGAVALGGVFMLGRSSLVLSVYQPTDAAG